ncbi:HAD family hydrolase [Sneathiella glossodoripedis]|uniref:HAD family hydrolase n=1 Tax=Sneathiella glossodoripedis TaxID=418853 RepID=UPI00047258A2|nr:HAD family phosphatase [Sneathiella glossodoripedis]
MRGAVIFDMDGLLLDTERIAKRTFQETCVHFNVPFEDEIYSRCVGSNLVRTADILSASYPEFPKKPFMQAWNELYVQEAILKPVPVKQGVREFLNYLNENHIPCAVATSSPQKNATLKLEHSELIDYFQALTFGDQVSSSKPHPEIYLTAASRLGIAATHCLALEDSDNGVRAAVAADMLVYQVPDILEPSPETLALGHRVVPSVADVHRDFFAATQEGTNPI